MKLEDVMYTRIPRDVIDRVVGETEEERRVVSEQTVQKQKSVPFWRMDCNVKAIMQNMALIQNVLKELKL